jgi:hypothetical protein
MTTTVLAKVYMSDHLHSSSTPHARPGLRVCLGDFPALFSEGSEPEATESMPASAAEISRRRLAIAWPAIFSRVSGRVKTLSSGEPQG